MTLDEAMQRITRSVDQFFIDSQRRYRTDLALAVERGEVDPDDYDALIAHAIEHDEAARAEALTRIAAAVTEAAE